MTDLAAFPGLTALEPEALAQFRQWARPVHIPAGTVLFSDGSDCTSYVLVAEGSVRVHKLSESGREIVLYRVERGQSCVLTTNCLLGNEAYGAEGVAETDLDMLVLPTTGFKLLLAASAAFRDFVFSAYASRISGLLMLIEEVAFGRVDCRLSAWLAERAHDRHPIRATHQDIAIELGTAREVVSRQLKEFERRGWVSLGRGAVTVINRDALSSLSVT